MISRLAVAGLAAVSLGSGAVAGALLFSPVVSGAQSETTVDESTTDESTTDETDDDERECGHRHHLLLRLGLEAAADAIGISTDDLRTELRDGQTIAEVAEDNDVDVQAVIDAMVAAGEARIDELVDEGRVDEGRAETFKENLPDRVTAIVNSERPFDGPRGRRHHHFGGQLAPETDGGATDDGAATGASLDIELARI